MITLTYSVIATYLLGQVTKISGFSGIGGINRYTPGWIGDVRRRTRTGSTTSRSGSRSSSTSLIRYLVRTPFGITLQGVRDEPIRMASLGYNVPLHRTLAFGFAAFIAVARRRPLRLVGRPGRAGGRRPAADDQPADHGRDRRSRPDRGRLGRRLRLHPDAELHPSNTHVPLLGFGGTLFGGSFNTVIGIIFLVIVIVSPDGLMGLWGGIFDDKASTGRRRVGRDAGGRAGEMTTRSIRPLESWVRTARESRTPSKHEREEGTTR